MIVRCDNQKILSFYGNGYQVVENKDFMLPIIQEIGDTFGYDQLTFKASSIDDKQFFLDVIVDTMNYEVTKDDTVSPMISFVNSYDGSLKKSVKLSYYRKICSNGMKGYSEAYTLSQRHKKGVIQSINHKRLISDLQDSKDKLDRFKSMSERRLLPYELDLLIDKISDRSAAIGFPKKELKNVQGIIEAEQKILGQLELTKWLAYNAFNNILNHTKNKITPADLPKVDSNILNIVDQF
jgi:hypothetical protein